MAMDPGVFLTDVQIQKQIGGGAFGRVYKGSFRNAKVAVKEDLSDNIDLLMKEAALLMTMRHPNIVSFIGVYRASDPTGEMADRTYLVMEYFESGSLSSLLRDQPLSFKEILQISREIAAGMTYLEGRHITHRDLAARNILVAKSGSVWKAKISDFGLSREQNENTGLVSSTALPFKWSAPELLRSRRYSSKSDVWSFAILLWEMIHRGANPYREHGLDSPAKMLAFLETGHRLTINPPKGITIPDKFLTMMHACWELDADKRPSFQGLYDEIKVIRRELKVATPIHQISLEEAFRDLHASASSSPSNTSPSLEEHDPYDLHSKTPPTPQEGPHNNTPIITTPAETQPSSMANEYYTSSPVHASPRDPISQDNSADFPRHPLANSQLLEAAKNMTSPTLRAIKESSISPSSSTSSLSSSLSSLSSSSSSRVGYVHSSLDTPTVLDTEYFPFTRARSSSAFAITSLPNSFLNTQPFSSLDAFSPRGSHRVSQNLSDSPTSEVIQKAVLIGGEGAGKSSLFDQYITHEFRSQMPTLGMNKSIVKIGVRGHVLRMNLVDTSGQVRFDTATFDLCADAQVLIVCFNLHEHSSFERAKALSSRFARQSKQIYLVATMCDLIESGEQECVVEDFDISNLALSLNASCFATSALTRFGMDDLLTAIGTDFLALKKTTELQRPAYSPHGWSQRTPG
eukprot:TRINITY_DN6844_c0_g1_i3.p1 TRINITY_DN6844_c0_g1~~TRINITY_DN6844_c0_g1_i3.p1  ORF type:complete len:688 (+),score=153.37 TRINITY_DN6844_c0_g1_i3:33-2096(+)